MAKVSDKIAVVTATGSFHPLRELGKVSRLLSKDNYEGEVIFDLLAVNGLANNRFVSYKFRNGKLDRDSILIDPKVPEHIIEGQNEKARNDKEFLEGSVLSQDEIEEFTKIS